MSGKLLVRLPSTLHQELTVRAALEGVSLNTLIVHLLSAGERIKKEIDICDSYAAENQRLNDELEALQKLATKDCA